jgi:hypothetical protein
MLASTLIRSTVMVGSPGYQMFVGLECLRTPMAVITMNQFGSSIAFATKRQLPSQLEI